MPNETEARPTVAERETREMRIFSTLLGGDGLSAFIAVRRAPGETWMTWEQVVMELHGKTGEVVTRAGMTNWAKRYGIPVDTRPKGDREEYLATVREASIVVDLPQ